jgi:SAM-dependent methyltransferase
MNYFAIDGSPSIVKQLHQRYPDLIAQILTGDFTAEQPFQGNFDLMIDRAALTHNNTASIQNALKIAFRSLKPGGIFIGSDWFSKNHSDFSGGEEFVDKFTRTKCGAGQFTGVGAVHFSDESHLRELFSEFEIVFLEEKLTRRYEPQDSHQFASWNIVARKPHV